MHDVIDIDDLTAAEIRDVYELTDDIKASPEAYHDSLSNETLLMFFAKPSTRTRVSFEAGMTQLGGHAIYFPEDQSQMSRGESLKDTAKVLSRYTDAIMARLFDHETMVELAEYADVPVINGLTDLLHPYQALSDVYTLREHGIDDGPLAFVGDGNNVAQSLMQLCATMDIPCRIATPSGYEPDAIIQDRVADADVTVTNDPVEAVSGAKAVYTDVFVSMGQSEEKTDAFEGYQVTPELMDHSDDAKFMHCLPAHRGEEVDAAVMDGPNSIVYDQAENRQHVQKAVLHRLLAD
ncbi:ornithine carbamoyltransferase [Halanaeroarchaeum sulfurireducens]|uniref:Ornithine carbamoyltransferase n=1 Tax=Halanaeroarchaeum sulfurireducens TaxID=1604004 RepID=A0A0N9N9I7_9EURY|nr:ornithine carbamoyltransferase [Halanaeroarchaeum sulfurireducens]ALG81691.1 ornithine carbamoyltransferase [Halanaeroarchaeum sulfurireducens]